MNCAEARPLLYEHCRGDMRLPAELSTHLTACRRCGSEFRELQAMAGKIDVWGRSGTPPASYFGTILPRLRRSIAEGSAPGVVPHTGRLAMPFAMAVALVFVLIIAITDGGPSPDQSLENLLPSLGEEDLSAAVSDHSSSSLLGNLGGPMGATNENGPDDLIADILREEERWVFSRQAGLLRTAGAAISPYHVLERLADHDYEEFIALVATKSSIN